MRVIIRQFREQNIQTIAPGIEDAEDLALLEARDLLFARLMQYRAYKDVSRTIAERLADEGRRFPRSVSLEPQHASLLPELVWTLGPEGLAAIAASTQRTRDEERYNALIEVWPRLVANAPTEGLF